MALTKTQIARRIAEKLVRKHSAELDNVELKTIVTGLAEAQWVQMVGAIQQGSAQRIGALIIKEVARVHNDAARAEADTMLTDDSLGLVELGRLLE
jgi:hypothetical protein